MSAKDIKEICRKLDKCKIQYHMTHKNHYRIRTPDGGWITMPSTPSKGKRSLDNTRSAIWKRIGIRV